MSTTEHTVKAEGTNTDGSSATDLLGIDSRYEVVPDVDSAGHLVKMSDPFIEMQYPLNENNDLPRGVIGHTNRWRAVQRPDGSGVVESSKGTRTYAVRIADGTILGNEETGFWFPYQSDYHQRRPDESGEVDTYDYDWFIQFPYRFVGETLTEFTDLDIGDPDSILRLGTDTDTFVDGDEFMRGVVGGDILDDEDERGVLLTHQSGVQVYVGWDSTSWDTFELFGFVPFDGDDGVPVPSAKDALDLLRPNEAVACRESAISRQGEWFLVPAEDEPEGTIQKPGIGSKDWQFTAPGIGDFDTRHEAIGTVTTEVSPQLIESVRCFKEYTSGSPLDNHIPRDWKPGVADETFVWRFCREFGDQLDVSGVETPQDCVDLLYDHEDEFEDEYDPYETVRSAAAGIYVRGSLRHRNNEHRMAGCEDWRRATTHEFDVMTQDGETYHLE